MDRHRHFTSTRPAMFHIGSASASTSTKNNFIAAANHVNSPVSPSSSFSTIITCAILSFAIAEILNCCGIFHDESGLEATRRKNNFLDEYMSSNNDLDSTLESILDGMELWWVRNRFHKGGILQWSTWKERIERGLDLYATRGFWGSLQCLCFKHQFAVGSMVGMMCQGISRTAGYTAFLAFVLGEMLQNVLKKDNSYFNGMCQKDDDGDDHRPHHCYQGTSRHSRHENVDHGTTINSISLKCIETIQSIFRQSVDSLIDFLNGTDEEFDNSIGTIIVGIAFGLVVKTIF